MQYSCRKLTVRQGSSLAKNRYFQAVLDFFEMTYSKSAITLHLAQVPQAVFTGRATIREEEERSGEG